jgi:hypothetical protein
MKEAQQKLGFFESIDSEYFIFDKMIIPTPRSVA